MNVELNASGPSHIVQTMSRVTLTLLLILACALPAFAQSTEVGAVLGGSRRSVSDAWDDGGGLKNEDFSFSNSSFELFYGVELEPGTYLKFKGGRIEGPVRVLTLEDDARHGHDVEGQVQHLSAVIEYRFSEAFGTTALFGGVGAYRHSATGFDSDIDYGWQFGLNADFPISRRYGVLLEATHHWTRGQFEPKYLTLGGGLRIKF